MKLVVVVTIFALMFFGGCEKQAPMSSLDQSSQASGANNDIQFIKLPKSLQSFNKIVTISAMVSPSNGGELPLESGIDQDLLELIQQTNKLKDPLINASPLSPTVLIAFLECPDPPSTGDIKKVLLENSPLRACVLEKLMEVGSSLMSGGDLKKVLIAASPLPQSIVQQLPGLGLSSGDYQKVMEAQVGVRGNEFDMNNGGGGIEATLSVSPGSVTSLVNLSLSIDDQIIGGEVLLTFGPHGTVFDPPARLNLKVSGLDLRNVDPNSINMYYINEVSGNWEQMQSDNIIVNVNKGTIQVINGRLPHFSRYAIGAE